MAVTSRTDKANRLRRQIELIDSILKTAPFSPDFLKWKRDTEVAIEKVFGARTRHLGDFTAIRYSPAVRPSHIEPQIYYVQALERARFILQSMVEELLEYGDGAEDTASFAVKPEVRLERIFDRFHLVVRQLRSRHDGRPALDIEDEYDVQDLLHALLRLDFDDVRPEEWTPSYAGGSARMDFLLKRERTVVEVKKTRKGLEGREVGDQLLVDLMRYKEHPDCGQLLCFVYDPEGRIGNPTGLESDLYRREEAFAVQVFIRPRA